MNHQESKKLEKKVVQILRKYIKKNDKIILGVSGGPDSVFLLQMCKLVTDKIIVAHLDHSLRKESKKEANFVKKISQSLIFEGRKANSKSLSKKNKEGLEETGRQLRYEFFLDMARKHQSQLILTAHHADDNLETIIFNFIRGSSLEGLCGINEFEKISENVFLLRPLLKISKREILDYLKFHHIHFCIDKSNENIIHTRNFIRHILIPKMEKINPSISETVSRNTDNLNEINSFLKTSTQNWIKSRMSGKNPQQFSAKDFKKLQPAIQKSVLIEIYKDINGTSKNLEKIHIEEVLELINRNIGNKKKKMGALTVNLKNNIVSIQK